MRRVILLCLFAFQAAAQGLPVEIQMKITSSEAKGKVYLEQLNDRGFAERLDSVNITKEPFVFSTKIAEPGIFQLNVGSEQLIGLVLDGGEKLSVEAEGITPTDRAPVVKVEGSVAMQTFSELQTAHMAFISKVKEIDGKFQASSNENTRLKLREEYLALLKDHNTQIVDKVRSLGTSAAGILAANNFLDASASGDYHTVLAEQIMKEGKQSKLALFFVQQVNKARMGLPGVVAPDFSLKNLKGEDIKLSDLRGKLVVLDFWATWCGPCLMSFPGMQKAMEKFKDRDDVAFVYINTFERVPEESTKTHVDTFVNRRGLTFLNTVLDVGSQVSYLYGVESIPTKFFIDKEGKFLHMSKGFAGSDDAVVEEITQWLAQ